MNELKATILLSQGPAEEFGIEKGVRQGDALFII